MLRRFAVAEDVDAYGKEHHIHPCEGRCRDEVLQRHLGKGVHTVKDGLNLEKGKG